MSPTFDATPEYSEGIRAAIDELRKEANFIGGSAVGFAGTPTSFYLQTGPVYQGATEADLAAMLTDKAASIRIMGAKCMLLRLKKGRRWKGTTGTPC